VTVLRGNIPEYAFYGMSWLEELVIENKTSLPKPIGAYAFYNVRPEILKFNYNPIFVDIFSFNPINQINGFGIFNHNKVIYQDGQNKIFDTNSIIQHISGSLFLLSNGNIVDLDETRFNEFTLSGLQLNEFPIKIIDLSSTYRSEPSPLGVFGFAEAFLGLTNFGRVFTYGSNPTGLKGNGTVSLEFTSSGGFNHFLTNKIPSIINLNLASNEFVVDVQGGALIAFALTSMGRIIGWGNNNGGLILSNSNSIISTPLSINHQLYFESDETVLDFTSTGYINIIRTSKNNVIFWPYLSNTSTSFNDVIQGDQIVFGKIKRKSFGGSISNISKVFISGGTYYVLTFSNNLYGWGQNGYGNLGIGINSNISTYDYFGTPQFIYSNVKYLYGTQTKAYKVLINNDGMYYYWGGTNCSGDATCQQPISPTLITFSS
jgi:alpha-tubulin suppressor-like RCC1 family protein